MSPPDIPLRCFNASDVNARGWPPEFLFVARPCAWGARDRPWLPCLAALLAVAASHDPTGKDSMSMRKSPRVGAIAAGALVAVLAAGAFAATPAAPAPHARAAPHVTPPTAGKGATARGGVVTVQP